jgi:hypothetical protein
MLLVLKQPSIAGRLGVGRLNSRVGFSAGVLVMLVAVGCASTPKQAARATPAAPSTPAATATPSAPATSADSASGQPDARLVSQGYKAVKLKDDYVYCRMESVTGTQFKKRVCLTADAIRDIEQKTQETQDSMTKQRTGPSCFPGTNC